MGLTLDLLTGLVISIDKARENLDLLEQLYQGQKESLRFLLYRYEYEVTEPGEQREFWARLQAENELSKAIDGLALRLDEERRAIFEQNPAANIRAIRQLSPSQRRTKRLPHDAPQKDRETSGGLDA